MDKSEVSFSRNIELAQRNLLQMKLTFKAVEDHEKYLGLPTYLGSSKKRIFQIIQDRVWKKLKGWKGKFLSQAGREILIKSVAQAIPLYAMQCFSLPVSILDEIEKMCRSFFWGQKQEERKMAWVSWEKMILPKKEGGLGMRDLRAVNKALLAKQAWRILSNGDSLMVKVLKGKYFPLTSFMEAKVSPNASFTWHSILSVRDLIAKGATKVIGNGATTSIWNDPWVPRKENFHVGSNSPENDDAPELVMHLIDGQSWNLNILNEYFSQEDVKAIQSIPLPLFNEEDRWAWHFTKDGNFSVKSAYFMELRSKSNCCVSTSNPNPLKIWKYLWRSRLPPKIKSFGWRALNDGLAVRSNLAKRGLISDVFCPLCGEGVETSMHLLCKCADSKQVWYLSPFRLDVSSVDCRTFKEWCEELAKIFTDKEWWSLFWGITWGIWLRRNAWVFNSKKLEVSQLIDKAIGTVGEYDKANMKPQSASKCLMGQRKWLAPGINTYKINSDAAFCEEGGVGLGAAVRDHLGDVVACCVDRVEGEFSVEVAEALAMRFALHTAIEAGFWNVILETDCSNLYFGLIKNTAAPSFLGRLISDIHSLASLCHSCSFSHVRRDGNRVTHGLAKISCKFVSMRVWLEEYPPDVNQFVMADIDGLFD